MTTSPLIDPLVVQILEANSKALSHTTNVLLDSYMHQADTSQATLDAIRDCIGALLEGPWMPTPDALRRALWPSEKTVDHYRRSEVG